MNPPNLPLKVRLIIWSIKILFFPFVIVGWFMRLIGRGPRSVDGIDGVVKLYMLNDNEKLYWEVWGENDGGFTVHWGLLGDRGKTRKYQKSQRATVEELMDAMIAKGMRELDEDEMVFLDVVWKVDGFGTPADLTKRNSAQDLLNQELGWLGLGDSQDASIGSDEMEVGCEVVDEDIGRAAIAKILQDTDFADYVRIARLN